MKICPNCGHENEENVKFCENCGAALTAVAETSTPDAVDSGQQKRCPRCRTPNPQESRFCENCGYDFATQGTEQTTIPDQETAGSEPTAPESTMTESAASDPTTSEPTPEPMPSDATNEQVRTTTPVTSGKTPATETTSTKGKQPKWQWLISALLLILLIGGGIYFLQRDTSHTAKPTASHTERKTPRQSQTSSSSRQTSHAATTNFDRSAVESDITTAFKSLDGTNSAYVSPVNGQQQVVVNNGAQSSASSIKVFILVTAYAMAKEGVFNLNATHTLTASEKVGGTGVIQNMRDGTKLTYREILKHMIDDSDNTGANIMIAKMGGFGLINNKIKNMGATDTKLQRKMMDTDAIDQGRDNLTSARDLGMTLKKLYNHQLVSKSADDEMLAILADNQNRTKLPKLLPSAAKVYNKTGEYADYGVQNDAEIVANRHGAFVAVVLSQDGHEADQVAAMNQLGLKLYQNILE